MAEERQRKRHAGRWGMLEEPTGRKTVNTDLCSMSDRWKIQNKCFRNAYFAWGLIVGREFGWEKAIELGNKLMYLIGSPEEMWRNKKLWGLTDADNDLIAISKVAQGELWLEGYDFDVVEESEERMVLRLLTCPWIEDCEDKWTELPREFYEVTVCGPGCIDWLELMVKKVDPDLVTTLTKNVTKGDAYCEYTVERKA